MYHVAEIVRDAKRDMQERYEDHSTWAAYTPFPFLYALSGQITKTMQRKAPDLVKRAAVRTRDQIADVITTSHRNVVEFRLTTTRTGQRVFYQIKNQVETIPLPGAIEPMRAHGAVPVFNAVEGFAQFVTSEELPELYFVAKNSMGGNVFLRHLVLPPLGAMERVVRYVVIFPSQIVFPSREEIETRTDLFLDVSTTRVQSVVEYIYSATEVLDQHWSMVQWNILGRGPYESLSYERRTEVIKSIYQRMLIIESRYKMYEFMASIKMQNEMLYTDVLKEYPHFGGIPLTDEEIASNDALLKELDYHNQNSFSCWFYKKLDPTSTGDANATQVNGAEGSSDSNNGHGHTNASNGKWIEFPPHENRRLERRYRWYQRQKELKKHPLPSSIVLVDEGRYEVCMETMEMKPVYWPALEKQVVCRSLWLYAQRNYGLAPYNPTAAAVLESSFTYYLSHYDEEKRRNQALEDQPKPFFYASSTTSNAHKWSLSVPVEGHLVEFKGPHDIMQYKRLLAGTTPFTSKRRVYRGDPRIKSDVKTLDLWKHAMLCDDDGRPMQGDDDSSPRVDDDKDIDEEIDHLVLIVHGIGDALKTIDIINVVTLRSIIDCATNLRDLHKEALRSSHFDHLAPNERPRVEFLPIEWHSKLHMEGLDRMISDVTLPAIPKLREFANDTILDVLFFMSPMFHQVILNEVAKEMNRVFTLFQSRNTGWSSGDMKHKRKKVSIIAHSLGAIICFDVLNHQNIYTQTPSRKRDAESSCTDDEDEDEGLTDAEEDTESTNGFEAMLVERMNQRSRSEPERSGTTERLNGGWKADGEALPLFRRRRERKKAPRARQQHAAIVPKLAFEVEDLFCFGSPVGLFLNVRGQKIDRDFHLPTCRRLFNIYHPYDPVAYRIEPIVNSRRANSKAVIIRTFEGKLRFQYQLKNSFRVMWQTLRRWRRDFEYQVEYSVRRIGLVESTTIDANESSSPSSLTIDTTSNGEHDVLDPRRESSPHAVRDHDDGAVDRDSFGSLCQGFPIDYTLQENEIEIANEYLFALTAHVIYWSNRDASLFVAQKLILEPPVEEAPAREVVRSEAAFVAEDPETQTASSSSSPSKPEPSASVRRRRQRKKSDLALGHGALNGYTTH